MAETYSMPERRGMPNWVAAVLILLCLGGAAYVAYEYGYKGTWQGGVKTVAVEAPSKPQQQDGGWLRSVLGGNNSGRNNRAAERPQRAKMAEYRADIAEGVSRSNMSRAVYARKGNVAVRGLADDKAADPWTITIEFLDSQSWVPREQVNLARVARALTASPRLAEHAQLTTEQKAKLLELQRDAELTAGEKAEFESMFRAWDAAGKDAGARQAVAEKIIAAVERAGAKHLSEARARVQGRAEQVTKLLTAEQLRKAREGPAAVDRTAGNRRQPATRPATRPATLPVAAVQ